MLKGWITAAFEDKAFLEELGIQVGPEYDELGSFTNCMVPEAALKRLEKYWENRFYWGLRPAPQSGDEDGSHREKRGEFQEDSQTA